MKEKSLPKAYFYAKLPGIAGTGPFWWRWCHNVGDHAQDGIMENKAAIISFSQGEKVKSGLIWCSQCVQLIQNLAEKEQSGALTLLQSLLNMVANEAQLARSASGDEAWLEAEKSLSTARVMINSGVSEEAIYHFTQALSQVNRISQRAMTYLVESGIFK
ncbi:MAG: hypothetical protein P8X96_15005 [Desulfobacteraceae bacterium]